MPSDKMPTGNLTAPTNNTVAYRRYVGGFGQPDGFGDMLKVRVNKDGRLEITIWSRDAFQDGKINSSTIALTNEQRLDLAETLGRHRPVKVENVKDDPVFHIEE